ALDNGSTASPVTLTTPPPVKPLGSAEQIREASRRQYARPRGEIEAALRSRISGPERRGEPVGRRRRRSS
ncbi:MAG: hypothetical protein ACRDQZ_06420, partial [Mycobacteriales bacterium]